jgi:hypothetical protein
MHPQKTVVPMKEDFAFARFKNLQGALEVYFTFTQKLLLLY